MKYKVREISINIKTLKFGQIRKYGDSEYEYELEVKGMNGREVKRFCTMILEPCSQTSEEWNKDEADSYFRGYYSFEQIEKISFSEGRYRYFVHSPSTC